MTLANGDFVDADDTRRRRSCPLELLPHVLFIEVSDRVPIEVKLLGNIGDGRGSAMASDLDCEASGEVRVVGEPVEAFAFHGLALSARDPTYGEFEVDAASSTIEVAHLANDLIVEGVARRAAVTANRFSGRRWSVSTTA